MSCFVKTNSYYTRNAFCGTWYLPHSHVHNELTVPIIMAGCIAHAQNGHISISGLKSDITIVFLDPNFSVRHDNFGDSAINKGYCVFFIAHAQNGPISTSSEKSDVTIMFFNPDFLKDGKILAILP